jgi:hypothetical protein
MVIIVGAILLILSTLFSYRLFKTNRALTFDSFVIGVEAFRIVVILVYEFAYDHLIILMICYFIESLLRAIVCSNFVSRVMLINGRTQRHIKIFQILYYSVITSFIIGLVIFSFVGSTSLECENRIYSPHWFILDGVDTFQSILILISALYLVRYMKQNLMQSSLVIETDTSKEELDLLQNTRISSQVDNNRLHPKLL